MSFLALSSLEVTAPSCTVVTVRRANFFKFESGHSCTLC